MLHVTRIRSTIADMKFLKKKIMHKAKTNAQTKNNQVILKY